MAAGGAGGAKPMRTEIDPGVVLYTTRRDNPVSFEYALEVTKFKKVIFTIDFTGSDNFEYVLKASAPRCPLRASATARA